MEIIFKTEGREFKAEVEDIEETYQAVQDGLIAMGYHKNNAKVFVEDLRYGVEQ